MNIYSIRFKDEKNLFLIKEKGYRSAYKKASKLFPKKKIKSMKITNKVFMLK